MDLQKQIEILAEREKAFMENPTEINFCAVLSQCALVDALQRLER